MATHNVGDSLERPPRRRFRPRKPAIALILILLTAAAGYFWVLARGGPDYYASPEYLLPPETGGVATWSDFKTFLEEFGDLESIRQMRRNEDLAALLLMTELPWANIAQKKDPHYRLLSLMAKNFVNTWFGREVTLAVLPPASGASPILFDSDSEIPLARAGILIIARTDIGFEENLAELIAHLYPDFALEERIYRGHPLYRYRADKTRNSFAYCRFGKTVVVSFRSPEFYWLENLVDRKMGKDSEGQRPPLLSDDRAFREAANWKGRKDGLRVFIAPHHLTHALRVFPSESAEGPAWAFWMNYLEEKTRRVEWGALRLGLGQGLRAESFWKTSPPKVARPKETERRDPDPSLTHLIRTLPADTSLFLTLQSPRLRETLRDLRERMAASPDLAKTLADFENGWHQITGLDFPNETLQNLGNETGAALTGLAGGALFPIPQALAWWECKTPAKAAEWAARTNAPTGAAETTDPVLALLFAGLRRRADHNRLMLAFNTPLPPPPQSAPSFSHLEPGRMETLWEKSRADKIPVVCVLADLENAFLQLRRIHNAAALWSPKVRKNFYRWETAFAAAQHLSAMWFTVIPQNAGIEANLQITVR